MRTFYTFAVLILSGFALLNCGKSDDGHWHSHFTKADSLADLYLELQDTLHVQWNMMINDDNQKIKAMHNLLHELMVSNPGEQDVYANYEDRLEQLRRMRFTQKSMANVHVVEEYDLASRSLISELIVAAESKREFAYNPTLQKLVDNILLADQRVMNYRAEYDSMVLVFNSFLETNEAHLMEADHNLNLDKKAVFQMISSD
jgi:hypothetical protein